MSRIWIGLILIVVLAGCQVQPEATPAELDRLQIELTPALDWLRPSFASCAADVPGIALTVETTFQAEQSLEQADILFRWSSSPPTSGEALKMGMDTLVLIVNPQNSLSELTIEQLAGIYSGNLTNWDKPASAGNIQAWVYPEEEDAQIIFARLLPSEMKIVRTARIAPDPRAMLEAVASDRNAIGFIPARWLDSSVKVVSITGGLDENWSVPILGVTANMPSGPVRDWLLCVQNQMQP